MSRDLPVCRAPLGSRREANKERTRTAIVDAVYALVGERGLEGVTAEQVAERADVSRRTFFNYFSSVEAVLADVASRSIDDMAQAIAERPHDESLFISLDRAVAESFDADALRRAAIAWRAAATSEATARHLAYCEAQMVEHVHDVVIERLADRGITAAPLETRTLACALIAAASAAQAEWLSATGGEVTPASLTQFNDLLREALAFVGGGFAHLDKS
ncbi:MAG: TetR/AcrR family transcriptional regulator [Micrococcales bacterium]|nr:TetR/AcrR family transcriptional regulator [Micrococcales bacterium]